MDIRSDLLSIVIPTYNEANNLGPLVEAIAASVGGVCPYEIIFVDDSADDTPGRLAGLATIRPEVSFYHRDGKKGLATAVVLGFSLAQGSVIAVMDADLQHPPQQLPDMYRAIRRGADIVLPSRNIAGGQSRGLGHFRKFTSDMAKHVGKLLLPSLRRISDPTGGYFMMKREVVAGKQLRPIGWKILIEVLVIGEYSKVEEIPYEFQKRYAGQSKMGLKVTIQYFLHIFSLIARSERERRLYLFVLVGLSGVAVDMLAFALIRFAWQAHQNLAATMSAGCAMASNYVLNRTFTWHREHSRGTVLTALEMMKYVLACSLGIGIKNGAVLVLWMAGLPGLLGNLSGIGLASAFNYFLAGHWVFHRRDVEKTSVPMGSGPKG